MLVFRQLEEYSKTSSSRRVGKHDPRYVLYLKRYLKQYIEKCNGDINRLTFLNFLAESDLAQSTKATIAQGLSRFLLHYDYLKEVDVKIIQRSYRQPIPDWSKSELNDEYLDKIVTYFNSRGGVFTSTRNVTTIAILSTVGMRISQLLEMEKNNLRISPNYAQFVFPSKKQTAMNDDEKYETRNVKLEHKLAGKPLHFYLTNYLNVREHYSGNVLICNMQGKEITQAYIQRELRRATERLGLPRITPHSFRHYVGNKLANEQGLLMAHKVLGHTDLNTTRRYLKNDTETLIY